MQTTLTAAAVNRISGWTNKCPKPWLETRRNTTRNTAYPGKPAVYMAHHFKSQQTSYSCAWHKAGCEQSSSNKWLDASSQEAAIGMQLFQHHDLSHCALHPSQLLRTPKGCLIQRWQLPAREGDGDIPTGNDQAHRNSGPITSQVCLPTAQIRHRYLRKKLN